jgi:hypothetical protein
MLLKSWAIPPVSCPQRFHLFGLTNPVFRRDLFREIAKEAVEQNALAAPQGGDAQFGREFPVVATQCLDFTPVAENFGLAQAQKALQRRPEIAALGFRNDQIDEVAAESVVARPSEDFLRL